MSYSIIKSDLEINKNDIISIGMRNLQNMTESRHFWNYENNPYGKAHNWLAKDENSGQFVGSGTLFPRRIFVNGEPALAAIAGDFAVDKEHRAYGPAIKLQKAIQSSINDNGFAFIYGIPNKLSETIFLRIGYVEIGRLERYVKVLRSEYKLKECIRLPVVTKLLSKTVDFTIEKFSKESVYKRLSYFEIERLNAFDERFDNLWQKASKQFKVISERSSKFLNWRYKQFPHCDYQIFSLSENKRKIAGYIVYYVQKNICYVVDMLFSDMGNSLDSLLFEFIQYTRNKGIFSISISHMGAISFIKKLEEWGFKVRDNDFKVVVYCPKISTFSNLISDKESWHFLTGDSDI